ncbi:MAG: hypothetical protein K1X75_10160 [Leptospirales bacterium]|nr:hypothetical protein [Leptospirales bacterium]
MQQGFRKAVPWILVLLFLLLGYARVSPSRTFTGDGLTKLIQARALQQGREGLLYPSADLDPNYRFYPFRGVYLVELGSRKLGPFPIAYAALAALLDAIFGPASLPLFNLCTILAMFIVLRYFWRCSKLTLLFAVCCTPLLLLALEPGENSVACLISFIGFSLALGQEREGQPQETTQSLQNLMRYSGGGLALGLAAWLRLEMLFFGAALCGLLFLGWLRQQLRVKMPTAARHSLFKSISLAAGLGAAAGALILFHFFDYGDPRGVRYLANVKFFESANNWRVQIWTTLVFAWLRPLPKLGYFGYMPALLGAFVSFAWPSIRGQLTENLRLLYHSIVLGIVLVPCFAPNDGVVTWGPRYLAAGILPGLIIADRAYAMWQRSAASGLKRRLRLTALTALFLFSTVATLLGLEFYHAAGRQLQKVQSEFARAPADVWLFTDTTFAQYVGLNYFTQRTMVVQTEADARSFVEMARGKLSGKTIAVMESAPMLARANYAELFEASFMRLGERPLPTGQSRAVLYRVP